MFPKPKRADRQAADAVRLRERRVSKREIDSLGSQAYQLARAAYFLRLAQEQGRLSVTPAQFSRMVRDGRRHLRKLRGTKQWPHCEMLLPETGCDRHKRPAMDVHHRAGRGPHLLNTELFVACCRACHSYVEIHRAWAYAEGWLVKRNTVSSGEDHAEQAGDIPAARYEEDDAEDDA